MRVLDGKASPRAHNFQAWPQTSHGHRTEAKLRRRFYHGTLVESQTPLGLGGEQLRICSKGPGRASTPSRCLLGLYLTALGPLPLSNDLKRSHVDAYLVRIDMYM